MILRLNTAVRNALLDGMFNTHTGSVFDGGTAALDIYSGAIPPNADVNIAGLVNWSASAVKAANAAVRDTGGAGWFYTTGGGTTGATEPAWNTAAPGNTTVDGTVTWIYIGAAPVLLAGLALPAAAFNAAGAAVAGRVDLSAAINVAAAATGTAAWCHLHDAADVYNLAGDTTATGGGGFMTLSSLSLAAGATVTINTMTFTQPAG